MALGMPEAAMAQLRTVLPFVHKQSPLAMRVEAELLFAEAALKAHRLRASYLSGMGPGRLSSIRRFYTHILVTDANLDR